MAWPAQVRGQDEEQIDTRLLHRIWSKLFAFWASHSAFLVWQSVRQLELHSQVCPQPPLQAALLAAQLTRGGTSTHREPMVSHSKLQPSSQSLLPPAAASWARAAPTRRAAQRNTVPKVFMMIANWWVD